MHLIIFFVAFLEWYTTLAVEVMAIRNAIPVIWSNIIATSILLGVVLVALSYGYYRWGILTSKFSKQKILFRLLLNLFIAGILYTFVSFPLEKWFLELLLNFTWSYFLSIGIVSVLLFFLPVFLASQTIPFLSELVSDIKKWEIIWKLLFYSTLWSFFGSLLPSLVLLPHFWLSQSILINGMVLFLLCIILIIFYKLYITLYGKVFLFLSILLISLWIISFSIDIEKLFYWQNQIYSSSTSYSEVKIFDDGERKIFSINWNLSSWIDKKTKKSFFNYVVESIKLLKEVKSSRILVVGGAWLTFPYESAQFDFVDFVDICEIDASLEQIAEEEFLWDTLWDNVHFYAWPARYCLSQMKKMGKTYDFIFLDAYNSKLSIPSHLLTYDFFEEIEALSDGIVVLNLVMDEEMKSSYAQNILSTLQETWSDLYFKDVLNVDGISNFVVVTSGFVDYDLISEVDAEVYFDDKHSAEIDKFLLFYRQ